MTSDSPRRTSRTTNNRARRIGPERRERRPGRWKAFAPLLVVGVTLAFAGVASAATPVPLGSASSFAVLGAETVTNTGPSIINGNLGVSPGSAVVGFPPGIVNGNIHAANPFAGQAQLSLTAAYNNAAGQAVDDTIGTELGGTTVRPGVYDTASGTFEITGTVTLDARGNANAVFIFQTEATLVTASSSRVRLINGAQACNIYWQVGSSATLGTNSEFKGTIMALASIAATTGATIDGRLLARVGEVTLDSNRVSRSRCDTRPPDLRTPRVPAICTPSDFDLRIRASDPLRVRTIDVFLDGRRIKHIRRHAVRVDTRVTIRAERLASGTHRIRVVARDFAGNRRIRRVSFRRCIRPAPVVSFTG